MSWLDTLEEIRKNDWTKASAELRESKSKEVINVCGYAAAAASIVPVPFVDLALLLPIHSAMIMTLARVHGRTLSETEAKRLVAELAAVAGLSFAGTAAISALKRLLLPGLGGLLSIPAMFALTWGLGRLAVSYFEDPSLSKDELKKVFEDALKEGKKTFSKEGFESFKKKNPDVKPAEPEAKSESKTPEPEAPKEETKKPAKEERSVPPPKKRTM